MKELLTKLLDRESLSREEATRAADIIMGGSATPSQIAGFLVALRMKGETAPEVAGFVESMRRHSVRLNIEDPEAVDSVGTGGDGAGSFNISTASALVAAAAGVTVAKHGNRSVSSRCGSADLLEATGGNIDPGPERVAECIDRIGFGYMFAPRFHPAMKHALPPRRELGVRTIFNILGPMTNPAGVKRLLLGVYDKALMPLMAEVLAITGVDRVMIVHSQDGLDEISISAPSDYVEMSQGRITEGLIHPEDVGLAMHSGDTVAGGDAAENLAILKSVLAGQKSAYRDVVVLNAGALIMIAGQADMMAAGVSQAIGAIDSGQASTLLANWVKASQL
jgi:anthranilate phosphoribosyltransferase